MTKVIARLAKVDGKLASRVSRGKIGSLKGRLFFEPVGGVEAEVSIFEFVDQGVSPSPWGTGEENIGHRFSVNVSSLWWSLNSSVKGRYFVTRFDGDVKIPVEVENHITDDRETYTTLSLKVKTEVDLTSELPPLEQL